MVGIKAAVLVAPEEIRTEERPEPEAGPGEVVVQVEGVGVCGSDVAVYRGDRAARLPVVQGHEAFGRVVAVGPGVDPALVSRRVVVEPNIVCLDCESCRSGRTSVCARKRVLSIDAPGFFAERASLPAEFAWVAPEGASEEDLVTVEPLAVAVAALRRADPPPGARVLVLGAGSQGLLLTLLLAATGRRPVVVDPRPEALALAEAVGAAEAAADPRGLAPFDVVFEAAGSARAVEAAIEATAPGGRAVLVGLAGEPASFVPLRFVRKGMELVGSIIYDHPRDFRQAIALVEGGLKPGRIVTRRYGFGEVGRALAEAKAGVGKAWVSIPNGRG
ncbi:MAG: alcohol dehydrogenase catalytic domain-containing protein [Clostridia bacterium]|nr:alcohol dehydrogenase catalytic domain-containing protein [Clostridia bacterium]